MESLGRTNDRLPAAHQPIQNPSPRSQTPPISAPSTEDHFVPIPPNVHPGMTFLADIRGHRFRVTAPPGTRPGQRVRVALPRRSPARSPARSTTSNVLVTVPAGVRPGQRFRMQHQGQALLVTCPQGAVPGQNIYVPVRSSNGPQRIHPESRKLPGHLQSYV